MEQSLNKKVFINPNFKRTERDTDLWSTEAIKTTHFNRHYVEDMPNRVTNTNNDQTMLNNRKIYVNPYFISGNNATQSKTPARGGYIGTNQNINNALNTNYSLVQNVQQNIVNKVHARTKEINKNNVQEPSLGVDPNFITPISRNHLTLSKLPTSGKYIETVENVNNRPNRQLLHKSKYSLVQNVSCVVNKEQAKTMREIKKNNAQVSSLEIYQSTKKTTQEVPLTRSRYCIVRKKKRLSITVEHKSENNLPTDLITAKGPVPITCSNQLTRYTNLHTNKNSDKNKLSCKTPEKITKMKITKYKIIPVKKNTAVEYNENKFVASSVRPYLKSNTRISSLINSNKNRFKFVKSSTPVSTIKATSRIVQHIEKGVCSGSKLKISKAKFNINNIPCRLFTKYGKCLRQDQGSCKYLHDKKHVSLCRKFLKGICHDKNCCLSHELTAKKMPTCYFYLKGMCTKDSCPYLHVKLSDKTKMCQDFAKGYCESGDKCLFKHVNVGQLKKTKKTSSFNTRRSSQNKNTISKQINIEIKTTDNCYTMTSSDQIMEKDDDCRYYKELANSDDSYENIKPKRCKLGTLPSFIQL